jgi:hypothetical protein
MVWNILIIFLGYESYKFNRTDIKCGSYGGKRSALENI